MNFLQLNVKFLLILNLKDLILKKIILNLEGLDRVIIIFMNCGINSYCGEDFVQFVFEIKN